MSEYKTCSDCGQTFPRTSEYFPIEKRNADGLVAFCRACSRKRRKVNRDARPELIKAQKQRSHERNRDTDAARKKKWREENLEHARARGRENYYKKRENRIANAMLNTVKRMARKRSLPDTLTDTEWSFCLEYFHHTCAVCGRSVGFWHTLAMDHWIPLSDPNCPGTVATNIVPLCHGMDGCNNSKGNRDPVAWLTSRFGKSQAHAIISLIQDYFFSLTTTP